MKYIVVGDLHLGHKKGSKKYYEVVYKLTDRIRQYADAHGIWNMIQVGDVFDNRKSLLLSTIDTSTIVFDALCKTFSTIHVIVGNHDMASKNSTFPNSLVIFNKHPEMNIITTPTVISDDYRKMLFVPYLFSMDELVDADICIGHFDINGAVMNSSETAAKGHFLNFSDFKRYQMTISGHYHTPNVYENNIHYIGTPYQMSFNDINSDRGFWVLDTSDLSMEFVEFTEYPKHVHITDKLECLDDIEGNIVRLVFQEDYGVDGNKDIISKVRELKPFSLVVKYTNSKVIEYEEDIDDESFNKTKLDILLEFFDKAEIPNHVNVNLLKKMTEQVFEMYEEEQNG